MSMTLRPVSSWQKWFALGLLMIVVFAVSALGSSVTLPKITGWYANLTKPSFNPPPWVFGPVWTILYVLMAVAAWRVWLCSTAVGRPAALIWFAVQLVLNAAWSPIFFGLEQPRLALVVIIALLIALTATVFRFFSVDRLAGWMLVPYLIWVGFATLLNGAIAILN